MYGAPNFKVYCGIAILLALGCALPLVLPEYFLYLGNTLMMYAILALGLDLLLGWSGQFAFAHIAFFGIGIYTSALLQMRLGVPFVVGVPLAAALAGLVGLLIAIPATRLRTVYLALATYAFAEFAQWVFRTWESVTKGPDGLRIAAPDIFGYVVGTDRRAFPVMVIILSAVLLAMCYLVRSKLGRDLCTIRDSEHVAAASGIDVKRTKVVAFVLSAVFAGLAGGAYTLYQSYVTPDSVGLAQLILVLTMVVVGGSGSIAGVLLGVVLIGLLPELLRAAPRGLLVWQEFAYGLILVLAVMFMPRGIWGILQARSARVQPAAKSVSNTAAASPAPADTRSAS
ncbi:MAG: branched-chain amino acid ABC transporter permease [Xanthobacteraceae bacterium]|nr:branched-chain amino acid ABC transporter permease [Xanthobacteraceae bacterium]